MSYALFCPTRPNFPYRDLEIKPTFTKQLWHNSHHLHVWMRITGLLPNDESTLMRHLN